MRLKNFLAGFALLAVGMFSLAGPATAGNTTLFSSTVGDITFPFSTSARDGSAGALDNMVIGGTTPRAGTFTTLSAASGFAGPVAATTLSASGAVTGAGFTARFAAPGAIGSVTPSTGVFTTLTGANIFSSGTAPAPTGTGTPTIATGSTDTAGEVTAGSSATSVVITFATAKSNAPFCVVTSQTQLAAFAYSISTSAITITQTATSGNKIDYTCIQH